MSDLIRRVIDFVLRPYHRWKWKRWLWNEHIGYPVYKAPIVCDCVNDSIPVYSGDLSFIKCFDHALTEDEVAAIYRAYQPKWYKQLWSWITRIFRRTVYFIMRPYYQWRYKRIMRDCIAFWPLDDTGGEVARDISGNGNDGTYLKDAMSDEGSAFGIVATIKESE